MVTSQARSPINALYLPECEVYHDVKADPDRTAALGGRPELPLLDTRDRGVVQHRYGSHDTDALDVSVDTDDRAQLDATLRLGAARLLRVFRSDLLDELGGTDVAALLVDLVFPPRAGLLVPGRSNGATLRRKAHGNRVVHLDGPAVLRGRLVPPLLDRLHGPGGQEPERLPHVG